MSTAPDRLSTTLSPPKPIRAWLPAASPAIRAITASTTFQPTVRYSRRRAAASDRALSGVTWVIGRPYREGGGYREPGRCRGTTSATQAPKRRAAIARWPTA